MQRGRLKKDGILPCIGLDCSFALVGDLVPGGCHVQLDEPVPFEAIPPRVRRVILNEFQGRWPSVHEIAQVSNRHWLATPGVGPTVLQQIRSITHLPQQQHDPNLPRLTDAELLDRLEFLQEELRWIRHTLKAKMLGAERREGRY